MIFRQLYDQETSTYTYLLGDEDSKEAIIIDSVIEQVERDKKLINELGLKLKYILETHVHADHITGAASLKTYFPDAQTVVHNEGGAECADLHSTDGMELKFGNQSIKILSTPGHTNGCVSYYTEGMIFTGDALLIRGCGRTDFQQGDPAKLYESVTQKVFTLPDNTVVYPGHDYKGLTASTVWEEKTFNSRLANKTKEEFTLIMNSLDLPYPKKIQESVPANLKCGNVKMNNH